MEQLFDFKLIFFDVKFISLPAIIFNTSLAVKPNLFANILIDSDVWFIAEIISLSPTFLDISELILSIV